MWDAYQKQDWLKVCSFVESQLRPLLLVCSLFMQHLL